MICQTSLNICSVHMQSNAAASRLLKYTLHLADNALVLGHRNSEWTGHGPILEQDIALSNIALDLIGQSRNFYQYAAVLKGENDTEDDLAFLRGSSEFLNCLIVEQDNGDWGKTIVRQFLMSAYLYPLYHMLQHCGDEIIAAIASKSLKEVTYHLRWSSEWVIRLGQGTSESHSRITAAVNGLWMYTAELYTPVEYEINLPEHVAPNYDLIKQEWKNRTEEVFKRAGLMIPFDIEMANGGKMGVHTPALEQLLSEMQYMQRTYPGMEW